ncbi:MAG: response regulator [Lacunisphaera sp.]
MRSSLPASSSSAPRPAGPPAALAPVNILLVDDEPRNLDVLEGLLASPEHRLVRANGATDALMALLREEFAVIVLDVQMPGTNGIELAHLIKKRERTQHVPIIFLTAFYDDERSMLESYEVGAVDYLTKPANPRVLRSKVGVFVDLFRKTAALQKEVMQRATAERALREINDALESRVEARTAALREARDAAERSGRAKDHFLAALSHELRTPLNPVLLLASEAAENPAFPPDARAQFQAIRRNVELEARLIDDLLDLTRITHGKLSLEVRHVDLHGVLRDALAAVQSEIEQKALRLRLELAAERTAIAADPVRLQQVFWNILKNAVKFTPAGGSITVHTTTDAEAESLIVTVTDTGIGLTPVELGRIFEAFAQGDHAQGGAHRFGGLGLGLTISKSLIHHHGGELRASSAGLGEGATFAIELPLVSPATPPAAAPGETAAPDKSAPAESSSVRRSVLLVEDHEASRLTLARLLRSRGYEVATAGSLTEARALVAAEKFNLLISDIGLPDGSGLDLMKEMQVRSDVRGVALTGYGMEEDVERSRAAGFRVHLTKPILARSLDQALAELQHG